MANGFKAVEAVLELKRPCSGNNAVLTGSLLQHMDGLKKSQFMVIVSVPMGKIRGDGIAKPAGKNFQSKDAVFKGLAVIFIDISGQGKGRQGLKNIDLALCQNFSIIC